MTLVAHVPSAYAAEQMYVITVLVEDLLGVPIEVHEDARLESLRITGDGEGSIEFHNGLFGLPPERWLTPASMDTLTTSWVASTDLPVHVRSLHATTPVIAFTPVEPIGSASAVESREPGFHVRRDLLGSAFFHLTRYEEVARPVEDAHGRYPAAASWAVRHGVQARPLVDEYAELLRALLAETWPRLPRKTRSFSAYSTHDVDVPFEHLLRTPAEALRQVAAVGVRDRRPLDAVRTASQWVAVRRRGAAADPSATFERIMSAAERCGTRSAFFFIPDPDPEGRARGTTYRLDNPAVESLLRDISAAGHEIGLHSSYRSFRDADQLRIEFETLAAAAARLRISQDRWGGRYHYLRWDAATSFAHWAGAGLAFDSTVGWAEWPGFRAGTCRPYRTFDLTSRTPLAFVERPLVLMDTTLLSRRYLGLDPAGPDAYDHVDRVRRECLHHGGEFVVLWHNNRLADPAVEALFEYSIRPATASG